MAQLTRASVLKSPSGFTLPVIGLGTWQSCDEDLEKALNSALEADYRLIDTAFAYENERVVGRVLNQWFSSGKLKREDIFITTKLPLQGNNPKYVKEYLEKQLKALQVEWVDLYLIHHAVGILPGEVVKHSEGKVDNTTLRLDMSTDHVAIWKEMEKQVDAGLTKSIGLSNFNVRQIERILNNCRIPPANLQIEMYLYLQEKKTKDFCTSKGITITSFGTLGSMGAPKGLFSGSCLNPLEDPAVVRMAKTHDKTPGQVLLRHMLQSGVAIIPKSTNPDRIRQNLELFDFHLSPAEMEELDSLDKGEKGRRFVIEALLPHPEHPYK